MWDIQYISEEQKVAYYETLQELRPVKIAPFQLKSGAYDVVNGAIQENPDINEETQYERVFTGQNSTILLWRESTKLVLKNPKQLPPYAPTDFEREYQVGKLYDFYLDTETIALGANEGSEASLSTLTGFVDGDVTQENIFDGYVVPRVGNFVYKFEIGTKYRTKGDNEVLYTEISLTKVNKIGTTEDITQVFQLTNSLGEGYAWPQSQIDDDGNEIISLDQIRLQDDPIKFLQFEFEDPSIIHNIYAYGRPASYGLGQRKGFEEPRLIFPYDYQSTDGNKLSGQIAPSDYYYYSNNLSVTLDEFYDKWLDKMLTKYSPESIRNFEGHITDRNLATTKATNAGSGDFGTTYWDDWTMNTSDKTINVLSPFAVDKFTYEATTTYTIEELNIANVFRHQHIQKLPIQETETTPRVTTEIPILGIVGKLLFVGTDSGWYNTDALRNRVGEVAGFIGKDYYDLLASTSFNESETLAPLPIDAFGEDRPESIMGISSMPNIFKFGLTDTFIIGGDTITEYNTKNLGIDINGDGKPPYLWELGKYRPVSHRGIGMAIDTPVIQSTGKTTIRMTAYNNDGKAVYSVRYLSTSKRTGDSRDITTIFNTSIWADLFEEAVETATPVVPLPPDFVEHPILKPKEPIIITLDNTRDIDARYDRIDELDFDLQDKFAEEFPGFDINNYDLLDIKLKVVGDIWGVGALNYSDKYSSKINTIFDLINNHPDNGKKAIKNGDIFEYKNIRLDTAGSIRIGLVTHNYLLVDDVGRQNTGIVVSFDNTNKKVIGKTDNQAGIIRRGGGRTDTIWGLYINKNYGETSSVIIEEIGVNQSPILSKKLKEEKIKDQ